MRSTLIIIWCILGLVPLMAADFPGTFVQNPGGNLAPWGLPGFYSTPARWAMPGFAVSYAGLGKMEQRVFGTSAEFGNRLYRVGFLGSYTELDTLYRQVYGEWDLSFSNSWLAAGGGYGLDIAWIPEVQSWAYHRYKGGLSVYKWGVCLSGLFSGYGGEPLNRLSYSLGMALRPGERLGAFLEWDGSSALVGTEVLLGPVNLDIAYRFPEFGVGLSLEITLEGWFLQGIYGFAGSLWQWHGFSAGRKISKKTIL